MTQFFVGLGLMASWPVLAVALRPQGSLPDNFLYLIGGFWSLFFDPIREAQNSFESAWAFQLFTMFLVGALIAMWLVVAALPFFGHWRGKQVIGLWAVQTSYAGAQAMMGYTLMA